MLKKNNLFNKNARELLTTQNIGARGEQLAHHYLREHGLRLLKRNFHCRLGEIDLVMQDKKTLVFVEVRLRKKSTFGCGAESITATKRRRLIYTAQYYLKRYHRTPPPCRFDVIALDTSCTPTHITWLKDAFQT